MNPVEMTAIELVTAYRSRSLSPREVTDAVLAQIDERDDELNAFLFVDHDEARAQAAASEERWLAGQPAGLFDGVPMSIKDAFLTAGWPTLRGSQAIDPDQPWNEDSPAVKRLKADGLVLLGKTNVPEIMWKAVTDSPMTGITRNPVDPRLTPGGSSGGSAAAVAAGMGPLTIGTDGGGSIRIPSSFCGLVGLKPTHGRVPMFPASPFEPLAHAGPMTRTVEDAAVLMDILSLPDHRDPGALAPPRLTFRGEFKRSVRGIHVAYSRDLGYVPVDDEVGRIVDEAVATIEREGVPVDATDPGFENPVDAFETMWAAGAATMLGGMPGARETIDPRLGAVWDRGLGLTAVDYISARTLGAHLGIHMGEFHERFNLLLTPTVQIPPFEAGHDVPPGSGMQRWPEWASFSIPFNMTQQPALTVPVGTTDAGLPVGLQIVGPRHSDDLVLAMGRFVENLLA